MIKEIRVYPRKEIERLIISRHVLDLECPWILISVYSDTTGPLIVTDLDKEILTSKGCVASQSLDFHDITMEEYNRFKSLYRRAERRFRLFSDKHAHKVLDFINKFKNEKPAIILVVHCAQGISRSGAIGLFACRYLGLDESKFLAAHPNIRPNSLVYDTLCKASNLQHALEVLWECLEQEPL